MKWNNIVSDEQLTEVNEISYSRPVLIFKHSTRCSISSAALNRIETNWKDNEDIPCFFIDLIRYREISNRVAEMYDVEHQSPQVLIIKDGKCVYNASHFDITYDDIIKQLHA